MPFASRIIFGELRHNRDLPWRLFRTVERDLHAHIGEPPEPVGDKGIVRDIRDALTREYPNMDSLLHTSIAVTLEILRAAVRARLSEIGGEVFPRILTSANEVHYEEENPPYGKMACLALAVSASCSPILRGEAAGVTASGPVPGGLIWKHLIQNTRLCRITFLFPFSWPTAPRC